MKEKLTRKDMLWFHIANANPPLGFYVFKDRFLRRFATPCGWDLQRIDQICWTCEGSGFYCPNEECRKCFGTGIFRISEHWLRRFELNGQIYHNPEDHATCWHENDFKWPEAVSLIDGKISHETVDSQVARRAFYRLLLRHEPCTFYKLVCEKLKAGSKNLRARLVWRLVRLRNRMDLFPANENDVPF